MFYLCQMYNRICCERLTSSQLTHKQPTFGDSMRIRGSMWPWTVSPVAQTATAPASHSMETNTSCYCHLYRASHYTTLAQFWCDATPHTCKRDLTRLGGIIIHVSSDIFVLSFFSLFFNCLQIQGGWGGTTGQSVRIITYAHIHMYMIASHRLITVSVFLACSPFYRFHCV